MNSRTLKNIDWTLIFLTLTISVYGIFAIYSAKGGGSVGAAFAQRQLMTIVVGLLILAAAAALDDNVLLRISGWLYWLNVGMLFLVDIMGDSSKGAQRWLDLGIIQIQPSEPAKVVIIITLAAFFIRHFDEIRELRTVLLSLVHMGLPLLLIFKQPDLGTALVFCAIWAGIALAAGVRIKHIAALALAGILLFSVAWQTNIIKPYQKQRLSSFMNPEADPRGSGYHVRQSKIAIGSGQVSGKGFLHGTQSQLDFIPEQHTDFIFTVVGEELGFVGSAALVILYWGLIYRIIATMQSTEERLGRMIAGGVAAMVLFHVFVNIGMTLQIMPVTGLPLPLFSYGRSNLVASMAALGLTLGVYARRHRITF